MWNLTFFGNQYQCTGNIADSIAVIPEVANGVQNQVPYINGQAADMHSVPPANTNVTFRPRASGKA